MRSGSRNAYTEWRELMFSCAEVANFKALDSHVTLIVDGKHALPSRGRKMPGVKDCCFAGIASESDESVARVAAHVDTDQFFINAPFHVHDAARTRSIRAMLNG